MTVSDRNVTQLPLIAFPQFSRARCGEVNEDRSIQRQNSQVAVDFSDVLRTNLQGE